MSFDEFKQALAEEGLMHIIHINDERIFPLIQETRSPFSVVLNIAQNGSFEVYRHDERGYIHFVKRNLSEAEACELALSFSRRAVNWNAR